jgi:hypothetical protein
MSSNILNCAFFYSNHFSFRLLHLQFGRAKNIGSLWEENRKHSTTVKQKYAVTQIHKKAKNLITTKPTKYANRFWVFWKTILVAKIFCLKLLQGGKNCYRMVKTVTNCL